MRVDESVDLQLNNFGQNILYLCYEMSNYFTTESEESIVNAGMWYKDATQRNILILNSNEVLNDILQQTVMLNYCHLTVL